MAKEKKIQVRKHTLIDALLANTSDGIIILNEKGSIIEINRAATKFFKYTDRQLLKQAIQVLFPDWNFNLQKYSTNKNYRKTLEGKKKNGKTVDCRLSINKTFFDDTVVYLVTFKGGESKKRKQLKKKIEKLKAEKKKTEEQLASLILANKKLKKVHLLPEKEKELMELKSRFVSMASHEFRTPLALIKSSASIISHYKTTETNNRREKHIQRIKNAVNNLTDILNDFTSLARHEEGEIDNQPILFDINDLMEDVVEEMRSFLKPNQEIITKCPIKNTKLFLDNRWIKNIFINLISNAIKFSDEDTSIYCTILIKNKKLHIIVQDEGQGIPESAKKYIFTRFFRASNTTNIQGTGLGLNIVKKYLELFNGKIWFESELGEGSTFFVEIPLINAKTNKE